MPTSPVLPPDLCYICPPQSVYSLWTMLLLFFWAFASADSYLDYLSLSLLHLANFNSFLNLAQISPFQRSSLTPRLSEELSLCSYDLNLWCFSSIVTKNNEKSESFNHRVSNLAHSTCQTFHKIFVNKLVILV